METCALQRSGSVTGIIQPRSSPSRRRRVPHSDLVCVYLLVQQKLFLYFNSECLLMMLMPPIHGVVGSVTIACLVT